MIIDNNLKLYNIQYYLQHTHTIHIHVCNMKKDGENGEYEKIIHIYVYIYSTVYYYYSENYKPSAIIRVCTHFRKKD